jgi:L-cysteine desulfidase
MAASASAPATVTATVPTSGFDESEDLSEEELATLLAEKLAQMQ